MSTRYELDIITSLRIDYFEKSRVDYFEVGAINEKKARYSWNSSSAWLYKLANGLHELGL